MFEYNYIDNVEMAILPKVLLIMLLVAFCISLIYVVCTWRIFKKAGKKGIASLVPFYNLYVMLNIAKMPGWYLLLLFIPVINCIISIIMFIKLAKNFGKSTLFGIGLIFLNPIFLMILAFDKNTVYLDNNAELESKENQIIENQNNPFVTITPENNVNIDNSNVTPISNEETQNIETFGLHENSDEIENIETNGSAFNVNDREVFPTNVDNNKNNISIVNSENTGIPINTIPNEYDNVVSNSINNDINSPTNTEINTVNSNNKDNDNLLQNERNINSTIPDKNNEQSIINLEINTNENNSIQNNDEIENISLPVLNDIKTNENDNTIINPTKTDISINTTLNEYGNDVSNSINNDINSPTNTEINTVNSNNKDNDNLLQNERNINSTITDKNNEQSTINLGINLNENNSIQNNDEIENISLPVLNDTKTNENDNNQLKICSLCGNINKSTDKFCSECGTKL